MKPYLAFWSYARVDDDEEILSRLRKRLESELHAQSGHRHRVFQDKDKLKIGHDWDSELDKGLEDADFLIPIITPSFFNSDACRGEVKKFLKREQAEGAHDLILPIYWISSTSISDDAVRSTDPMAEEIARHQWGDWRGYRHLPLDDYKWRELIAELADAVLARYKETVLRALRKATIEGRINWPDDRSQVFREVVVKGYVSGLPRHCQLWLAVSTGSKLHPQARINSETGKWSAKVRIGSGAPNSSTGQMFDLQLLAVTTETGEAFSRYLSESAEAKTWLGIRAQDGCRCIHEIKVIRDDKAASDSLAGTYLEHTQGPTGGIITVRATANPNHYETQALRAGHRRSWQGTMLINEELPDLATGTYGYTQGTVDGEHTFIINRSRGEITVIGKIKDDAGTTFKTMWKRE